MNDEVLQRYTRQMTLPQFGEQGQQALEAAHVLIIGIGGLGSPAAMYLAAAGVGEITLVDFDRVAISNLHRQILYDDQDLGVKKPSAAAAKLEHFNPHANIHAIGHKLSEDELVALIGKVDIVLDCSDNFPTRFAINRACVLQQKPLVAGAAIRLEGQIAVFNRTEHSPCYACLYSENSEQVAERCSDVGVLGPVAGIIGSMQALEAIKLLANIGDTLDSRLLLFDAEALLWRTVKLSKDKQCPVCAK